MNFLSIISGLLFSIIGIAYFIGEKRGVPASLVGLLMFIISFIFFLVQIEPSPLFTTPSFLLIALSTALVNLAVILLVKRSLDTGMKSSMWIALNINFIPQTIYCLLRFKEPVTAGQSIGMVLGLICILILSEAGNSKSNADSGKLFSKSVLKNLPILLGLLISNSVLGIAIKELSNTPYGNTTMWDVGTIPFYLIFYGSVMLLLIPFALFNNFKREILPKAILPGLIAAAGSTGGMVLVGIIINTGISAASFFPIISVTSILTGSLSAVLFFKEKVTKTLIFGNILAFASILSTVLF